jgi:hypothetical protein
VAQSAPPTRDNTTFATFYDGAQVMSVVDAIVKSHQQQRWVNV